MFTYRAKYLDIWSPDLVPRFPDDVFKWIAGLAFDIANKFNSSNILPNFSANLRVSLVFFTKSVKTSQSCLRDCLDCLICLNQRLLSLGTKKRGQVHKNFISYMTHNLH